MFSREGEQLLKEFFSNKKHLSKSENKNNCSRNSEIDAYIEENDCHEKNVLNSSNIPQVVRKLEQQIDLLDKEFSQTLKSNYLSLINECSYLDELKDNVDIVKEQCKDILKLANELEEHSSNRIVEEAEWNRYEKNLLLVQKELQIIKKFVDSSSEAEKLVNDILWEQQVEYDTEKHDGTEAKSLNMNNYSSESEETNRYSRYDSSNEDYSVNQRFSNISVSLKGSSTRNETAQKPVALGSDSQDGLNNSTVHFYRIVQCLHEMQSLLNFYVKYFFHEHFERFYQNLFKKFENILLEEIKFFLEQDWTEIGRNIKTANRFIVFDPEALDYFGMGKFYKTKDDNLAKKLFLSQKNCNRKKLLTVIYCIKKLDLTEKATCCINEIRADQFRKIEKATAESMEVRKDSLKKQSQHKLQDESNSKSSKLSISDEIDRSDTGQKAYGHQALSKIGHSEEKGEMDDDYGFDVLSKREKTDGKAIEAETHSKSNSDIDVNTNDNLYKRENYSFESRDALAFYLSSILVSVALKAHLPNIKTFYPEIFQKMAHLKNCDTKTVTNIRKISQQFKIHSVDLDHAIERIVFGYLENIFPTNRSLFNSLNLNKELVMANISKSISFLEEISLSEDEFSLMLVNRIDEHLLIYLDADPKDFLFNNIKGIQAIINNFQSKDRSNKEKDYCTGCSIKISSVFESYAFSCLREIDRSINKLVDYELEGMSKSYKTKAVYEIVKHIISIKENRNTEFKRAFAVEVNKNIEKYFGARSPDDKSLILDTVKRNFEV